VNRTASGAVRSSRDGAPEERRLTAERQRRGLGLDVGVEEKIARASVAFF
jgi:hypothetical protein